MPAPLPPRTRRRLAGSAALAMALAAWGCTEAPPPAPRPHAAPLAPRPAAMLSVLRLSAAGGPVRAYRAGDLAMHAWQSADRFPPAGQLVGADAEGRHVYALDAKLGLVDLELDLRRVKPLASGVRHAALAADGAVFATDSAGHVTRFVRRRPIRFRDALPAQALPLLGAPDGTLYALAGDGVLASGAELAPATTGLPAGSVAATMWADRLAVATDSGLGLYDAARREPPEFRPMSGAVTAALFSPSGHRMFVARARGPLLVFDRFVDAVIERVPLPGGAADLRGDRDGAWLLARSARGDTVHVIDAVALVLMTSIPLAWAEDLPAVASPGTLLARQGADVVALDLDNGLRERGRVRGGAADRWLVVGWAPRNAPEPKRDTTTTDPDSAAAELPAGPALEEADPSAAEGQLHLQVSSSRNPEWVGELASKFRAQGLPAAVVQPTLPDEPYRVVLGPYPDRDAADQAAARLGMPSFVVTVKPSAAVPPKAPAPAPMLAPPLRPEPAPARPAAPKAPARAAPARAAATPKAKPAAKAAGKPRPAKAKAPPKTVTKRPAARPPAAKGTDR
ncbi:MAG: SPOR domain-containing protein [Gemmatimonadales bacterium]|nr:SPOR domain-containing protein [Gemmatimonadales bacterium]